MNDIDKADLVYYYQYLANKIDEILTHDLCPMVIESDEQWEEYYFLKDIDDKLNLRIRRLQGEKIDLSDTDGQLFAQRCDGEKY